MKFEKDILVKYLTYNYYCNTKFQEDTIKKVDVRMNFGSIFLILKNYKDNKIKQDLVHNNIYYTIKDCENTIYNLKINKIYDEKKEFKESYIQRYLDVFFIELFGENKEKNMNYNFDKQKFKRYFNWGVQYTNEDIYNSSSKTSYSEIEIEQKEQEIHELKDKLGLCEKETEKIKQQKLDLQEKINEYEKQLQKFNQFKDLLKEIFN